MENPNQNLRIKSIKPIDRWILYCEPCNYKEIVDESKLSNFIEIPTVPLCTGVPLYDEKQKRTIVPELKKQSKRVKCPQCGRGVVLKSLPEPYKKELKSKEEAAEAAKREEAEMLAKLANEEELKVRQAGVQDHIEVRRRPV